MSIGRMNSVASSAYKLVINFTVSAPIGVRRPHCVAISRIRCSGSIAIMNSRGDSGSPCLSPRRCCIGFPASPLSKILEVVVLYRIDIRSCQRWPKPNCSKTSNMYSHRTLSNALAMSSFNSSIGDLDLWKCLTSPYMY
jgi:hypothetical protein